MDRLSILTRAVETRRDELNRAKADLIDCESALATAKDAAVAACSDAVKYRAAQRKVQAHEAEQTRLLAVIEQGSRNVDAAEKAHNEAMRESAIAEYNDRVETRNELLARSAKQFLGLLHQLRGVAEDLDGIEQEARDDLHSAKALGIVPRPVNALHYLYAEALRQNPGQIVKGIDPGYADSLPLGTVSRILPGPVLIPGSDSTNIAQRAMLGCEGARSELATPKPKPSHLALVVDNDEPEVPVVAAAAEPAAASAEWQLVTTHNARLMGLDVEINEFALGSEHAFALAENGDFEPGERRTGGANIASWRGIEIAKIACDSGRFFTYQPRTFNFEPLPSGGYKRVPCERVEPLDLKSPNSAA